MGHLSIYAELVSSAGSPVLGIKPVVRVLPPTADGELRSIFDYMPGRIASPDQEVIAREQERLLGEFRAGFEETLGKRERLASVFRGVWAGEKRREIAQRLGKCVKRIKGLQREVNRRLGKSAAKARAQWRKCWGRSGQGRGE